MLNVAVVGLGWWGKTLVSAISHSSKLRVVKAMKRNPATDAAFALAHGFDITADYTAT